MAAFLSLAAQLESFFEVGAAERIISMYALEANSTGGNECVQYMYVGD